MMFHSHSMCFLVRELSLSLHQKPGINDLLAFATQPHTRLLNTV